MAKRNRNITSTLGGVDQQQQQYNFRKQPTTTNTFHAGETGSSSQSNASYKQLKYNDETTDTGTESNGGTPPKMQTLSAVALNGNGTSTTATAASHNHNTNGLPNGFTISSNTLAKLNGFAARQHNNNPPQHSFSTSSFRQQQLVNGLASNNNTQLQHHNPVRQIQSATVMPTNNTTTGHYSLNLVASAAANNNTTGKRNLIDLSRATQHPMSSSSMPPATSPIHLQPLQQLGSSSGVPTESPVLTIGQQQSQQQPHSFLPIQGRSPPSCLSFPSLSSMNDTHGLRELLSSLALMCILSLLTSFLALFFLQRSCPISLFSEDSSLVNGSSAKKLSTTSSSTSSVVNNRIAANAKEYMRVYQISISLSTLTLCFDLCCLFVCCIQFLSIVKLMKSSFNRKRVLEFVKKTSHIRILAIGAYLVSIPIFFTGVILFTFVNFDEIPALITSIVIGVGIIFCGIAAVQNVYLWQWEKTKVSEDLQQLSHQLSRSQQPASQVVMLNTSGCKNNANCPLELSTLV